MNMETNGVQTLEKLTHQVNASRNSKAQRLCKKSLFIINDLYQLAYGKLSLDIINYNIALNVLQSHRIHIAKLNTVSIEMLPIRKFLEKNQVKITRDSVSLLFQLYLFQLKLVKSIKFKLIANLIVANCLIIQFNLSSTIPIDLQPVMKNFMIVLQDTIKIAKRDENFPILNHAFLLFKDMQYVYENKKLVKNNVVSMIPDLSNAFENIKILQRDLDRL